MTIETKRRVAKGLQLGLVVGVLVGLSGLIQMAWLADPIPALAQTVTVDSTQSPLVVNAVADLADLTPTDGQSVIIKTGTEKGLWYYDKDSATATGVSVLNGPGSVGRFLVINNDAGSVAAATAITAAEITDDSLLELQAFDGSTAKSLTLEELKKTGVQVVNVKQYGATVNGVADDTAEIQAALTAAGDDYAVVIDGPCYVSDSLTIPAGGRLIGVSATAELIGPEDWFNKPVVILNGDYCLLENIKITETNASAQNQDKDAQSANIGVDVRGAYCKIRDVQSSGFGFPFSCQDGAADGSRDNVIFERCTATNGIQWGFEIDSVKNARYLACTAHSNGYDGFKAANEYSRTCDGLYYEGCIAYNNGLRDTVAGGFESSNGNGWDLYNGGYRFKLVGCRAYANYGAGINVKGGGGGAVPIQGEGSFVNCESIGNLYNSGGTNAGIEIGTGGDVGHSFLSFTNCLIAENDGNGIYILGGYGITCTDCRFIKNKSYGAYLISGSSDVTFQSCSFVRNTDYQASVGSSNSGTYLSKRVKFLSCYFNASYDPFLAATSNSWSTAAEAKVFTIATANTVTSTAHGFSNGDVVQVWKYTGTLPTGLVSGTTYWVVNKATDTFQLSTTKGGSAASIADDDAGTLYVTRDAELAIRIYTDSSDVSISDCSFANHWSTLGQVYSTGKRVSITRSKFYKGNTCSLTIGNGTAIVRDCYFKDPDLTGSTSIGVLACVAGSTSVYDCEFERSGGASGTAVRFYNGSTLNRFERLTATNFSSTIVASAGTTFATVEASTAGSGAPNVLTIDESPKLLTNEGTTAVNYHTLPTASEGLTYTFTIPDTDGMRITAATGDTIRLGANVTATAGYVESTSQGGYLTVTAINATEWIGLAYGTWTNGTWTYEVLDTP